MPSIDRPGARIHYEKTGEGPAVVLVQGVGVIGEGWRPQVDALAAQYTAIVIDNRGIGRSRHDGGDLTIEAMADDVLAVADREGIQRFHLAGHSMGGVIAQRVALQAADRVLSLSLLCTFLRGRQGSTMSAGLLITAMRSRVGTRRMRRRAFVSMVMPPEYLASVDVDALCERLHALFGRDLADSPPVLMRQLRAMSRFDASADLARLSGIPTLVVSAAGDRIAKPEYGRALAAAIPGARYVEVPDAAHAVTIQRADVVNQLLTAHFAAVQPAES